MQVVSRLCRWSSLLVLLGAGTLGCGRGPELGSSGTASSQRGFVQRTHQRPDGTTFRYLVFVPHEPPETDRGYPVLMFLHGAAEGGTDGFFSITNNFGRQVWELKGRFPFLCVMPQSNAYFWDPKNIADAISALDEVLSDYNTDSQRIYLGGVSSGGSGISAISQTYPNRFAAVFAIGAGGSPSERTSFWGAFNAADLELGSAQLELRYALIKQGLSPRFTQYVATGHDSWNFALRDPALYRWLLSHSASPDHETRDKFEPLVDANLTHWEPESRNGWVASGDHGIASIDQVISFSPRALEPARSESQLKLREVLRDFELHFDYRSVGMPHLQIDFEFRADDDDQQDPGSVRLVIVSPDLGSGGVLDQESGRWLATGDPVSQCSLRPNIWNDVRIRKHGDRLAVEVNGWPFAEFSDERLGSHALAMSLVGRESFGPEPRWREIRYRRLPAPKGLE